MRETLAVSHRWVEQHKPDPDGEQLKALKAFLKTNSSIKRVWIDAQCMPQDIPKGTRSKDDNDDFHRMLMNINMLYLGASVLILYDLSYMLRFWTQFECWLGMQQATPCGLQPSVGVGNERYHITCIHNAAEQSQAQRQMLISTWAHKTPQQAYDFLKAPDVTVTNQSDKDRQLPKVLKLNQIVQQAVHAAADPPLDFNQKTAFAAFIAASMILLFALQHFQLA